MAPYQYAILYHNYYSLEGIEEVRSRIAAQRGVPILLLCSLPEKFAGSVPIQREHEKFVVVPNVGKDIGGKLILIQLLLSLYSEIPYAILVHDKRSYQKHSGYVEKEGLFSILEPIKFRRIARGFAMDPGIGIGCAKGYLKNEYLSDGEFDTNNSKLLGPLAEKYHIQTKDFRFVAGTMFWIRTVLLRDFFSRHPVTDIRATLEAGNVLDHENGTITHCWERLLSWIAPSAGFKIKEF